MEQHDKKSKEEAFMQQLAEMEKIRLHLYLLGLKVDTGMTRIYAVRLIKPVEPDEAFS